MKRDILTIRPGECRFCVTDDSPFFFCAEPIAELPGGVFSSYCPTHHILCHDGFGRPVQQLEAMIYAMDHTVGTRDRNAEGRAVPVDVQISDKQ